MVTLALSEESKVRCALFTRLTKGTDRADYGGGQDGRALGLHPRHSLAR